MPGPVPNRSDDLSRDRDANRGDRAPITQGEARPVKIPNADREWHPIAKRLWESLKNSGQVDFYQQSDWAYAWHVMEELSLYKKAGKRSSMMFTALDAAMTKLLVTEGDRRRARIELQAPEEEKPSAAVLALADYRQDLEASASLDDDNEELDLT